MKYPKDYVPELVYYHVHSMLSNGTTNIDSVTDYHDLVDAVAGFGCKSMGISEHGNTFGWYKKKQAIESAGMKYLHAVEAYLTEEVSFEVSITGNVVTANGKLLEKVPISEYHQREDGAWIASVGNTVEEHFITGFLEYDTLDIKKGKLKHGN